MTNTTSRRNRDWHLGALCAQIDPELFFPERGASTVCKQAKAICQSCEVRQECLNDALTYREEFGVWGGTSPDERLAMLRKDDPTFTWKKLAVVGENDTVLRGSWGEGRTTCFRGHDLVPDNIIVSSSGDRRCRKCKQMHNAKRSRRKRQERDDDAARSA